MRVLSLACLSTCLLIANSSWQCFNVHPSHAVSNSDSIAELYHVTAGECLNYCISQAAQKGEKCVSVVFHRKFRTCQLYSHNGTVRGAEVVYLEDHDIYIRSSWEGQCADKIPVTQNAGNEQLQGSVIKNDNSYHNSQDVPKFELSDFPKDPNPQDIRGNVRKAPSHFENQIFQEIERQEIEDEYDMDFITTTTAPKKRTHPDIMTTFRNTAHHYKCEKDQTLSYFLVYGSRLSTRMLAQRLNGVDQSSCLMYCSQNINAIGQNIPCYSLNYEPTNEICEMYGEQDRNQNSSASLVIDEEHNFGDKFCMKTKTHCDAETLYPVYFYKKMTNNIIAQVPGLDSKVSCLTECIENKRCKAVTFKNGMCVLHSASPTDDSTLLQDGNGKTMVIENGCHIANQQNNKEIKTQDASEESASSWQEWSLCQYGVKGRKMRVRQRECDDCEEDMQIEEC